MKCSPLLALTPSQTPSFNLSLSCFSYQVGSFVGSVQNALTKLSNRLGGRFAFEQVVRGLAIAARTIPVQKRRGVVNQPSHYML